MSREMVQKYLRCLPFPDKRNLQRSQATANQRYMKRGLYMLISTATFICTVGLQKFPVVKVTSFSSWPYWIYKCLRNSRSIHFFAWNFRLNGSPFGMSSFFGFSENFLSENFLTVRLLSNAMRPVTLHTLHFRPWLCACSTIADSTLEY